MRIAIFPGSFDPITNGHLDVLNRALKDFDEVILLLAINPDKKSRFSLEDRLNAIKESIKGIKGAKAYMTKGMTVDYAHKIGTTYLIRGVRSSDDEYEKQLADSYHKMDSKIHMVYYKANDKFTNLSSSLIESLYKQGKDISNLVPKAVKKLYEKR